MWKMNGESVDYFLLYCEVHTLYVMLSSVALVCFGLCLFGWLIYLFTGRRVVAFGVLLCARWFILTFWSACEGNETIEISRTKIGRLRSSLLSSFFLCSLGLLRS
jgi:hypothetical protein